MPKLGRPKGSPSIPRDFKSYVLKKRTQRGWTQQQLAIKAKLSQPSISHYEVGYVEFPRLESFLSVVYALEKHK